MIDDPISACTFLSQDLFANVEFRLKAKAAETKLLNYTAPDQKIVSDATFFKLLLKGRNDELILDQFSYIFEHFPIYGEKSNV